MPFVLAGLAYRRALEVFRWSRTHSRAVTRAGGVMLVAVGVLLATGGWEHLVAQLRAWTAVSGSAI